MDKVEMIFTLFDDDSVREKLTIMDKWEAVCDDERNDMDILGEKIEEFLEIGHRYRVIVEKID